MSQELYDQCADALVKIQGLKKRLDEERDVCILSRGNPSHTVKGEIIAELDDVFWALVALGNDLLERGLAKAPD